MKIARFAISLALTLGLLVLLSQKFGQLPPIGKFFDPFQGFWQNAETKKAQFEAGEMQVEGLREQVRVSTDKRMVPHVFANNEHDMFFMQGYLQAKYRLWQMGFQVRATAGRISEIVGKDALPLDRKMRRIGLKFGAKKAIEKIDQHPETKNILSAYRDGINAYIEELSYDDYPVEYKLLDYEPEKWTNLKTTLLLKYMANSLTNREFDLPYTNALKKFGTETFNLLYPEFPDTVDPVIPQNKAYDFEPKAIDSTQKPQPDNYHKGLPYTNYDRDQPTAGSNNWAVSGAKTASGQPILCNDPHLDLNIPSIWFEMQLSAPGYNTYGATLPGSPGVIIGFNNNIAWGVTNASWDVMDWYDIQFKSEAKEQYRYDGEWRSTEKVVEKIKIRGEKAFYDTIVHTHHGPVVHDNSYPGEGEKAKGLALEWMAHEPSNELRTFYHLNKAKNYNDYVNALKYYKCPAQNFAFASTKDTIAIWQNGQFPLQWEKQGRFIMDGTSSAHEWQGFIPHQHNPHVVNPERDFVSSANQHPTDTSYPYYYNGIYEYWRNRRINDQLSSMNNIQPKDMKGLQQDNFNLKAKEVLPVMLNLLHDDDLSETGQKAIELLENWNFFNNKELKAPTVYAMWWDSTTTTMWDEMKDTTYPLVEPNEYTSIQFLRKHQDHELMDIESTEDKEDAADVVSRAFAKTVARLDTLDNWQWGPFKGTRLKHLGRIDPFNIENLPIGGNRNIVNATSKTHGPSWRMVVSLTDPVKAYAIYPGGQSGNPGSPYYDNFALDWAKGNYYELLFMKEPDDRSDQLVGQQAFRPETANRNTD